MRSKRRDLGLFMGIVAYRYLYSAFTLHSYLQYQRLAYEVHTISGLQHASCQAIPSFSGVFKALLCIFHKDLVQILLCSKIFSPDRCTLLVIDDAWFIPPGF